MQKILPIQSQVHTGAHNEKECPSMRIGIVLNRQLVLHHKWQVGITTVTLKCHTFIHKPVHHTYKPQTRHTADL